MYKKYFFILFVSFLTKTSFEKKPWTIAIYMAADNDLSVFAQRSIKQMQRVGTNKNINIVVHFIGYEKGSKKKIAKTMLVEKESTTTLLVKTESGETDSGIANNLLNFCKETIAQFPSEHIALIFWNHGTGCLDYLTRSYFKTDRLFSFSKKIDFQSTYNAFAEPIILTDQLQQRGVCFDDSTGNFLSEYDLISTLQEFTEKTLHKKFDIIGFDACFMAMVEIASSLTHYADFMIGSQETELGEGWNYTRVLAPFIFQTIPPELFSKHIVNSYKKTYKAIDDYTLSAIRLDVIELLQKNISSVADLLTQLLQQNEQRLIIKNSIKESRHKHACTHFSDPDFIDLHHWYKNMLRKIQIIDKNKKSESLLTNLQDTLENGILLIEKSIIKNCSGSDFSHARGLSIYFPMHTIQDSYRENIFTQTTNWLDFLYYYLHCI